MARLICDLRQITRIIQDSSGRLLMKRGDLSNLMQDRIRHPKINDLTFKFAIYDRISIKSQMFQKRLWET